MRRRFNYCCSIQFSATNFANAFWSLFSISLPLQISNYELLWLSITALSFPIAHIKCKCYALSLYCCPSNRFVYEHEHSLLIQFVACTLSFSFSLSLSFSSSHQTHKAHPNSKLLSLLRLYVRKRFGKIRMNNNRIYGIISEINWIENVWISNELDTFVNGKSLI